MNVIYAFPFLLFVLAVVAVFKDPGLSTVYVAIGLISWVSIARVLRAQFMQLREMEFVEAAKALGLPSWRILFVHILPSAMAPVIVQATMGMGGIIMIEAGLAFLGFGAQPPTPSWGLMISEGQQYLASGIWWWSIFPGLAIMYTVLAFNFLGDGLRDALDVRMKR
jgi:peptide/nickel transport system permease protein/oligopeptide transport system permease protein